MKSIEKFLSYEIGAVRRLSENEKQVLIRQLEKPPGISQNKLAGRIHPHIYDFEGFGRVVIKHYFRGGVLRHINKRTFLKIGKPRCRAEFEVIDHIRRIGINVPLPIAFASVTKGCIFYHAWLITQEIPGARTLAELADSAPEHAIALMPAVSAQINKLINEHILHVDLHPGNILADADDKIYLIDFDRARFYNRNKNRLISYYSNRWNRAIAKHCLPGFLRENLKI